MSFENNNIFIIINKSQFMGKTTYSRNPTGTKSNFFIIQLQELQQEILEFTIKTHIKLLKPSKV